MFIYRNQFPYSIIWDESGAKGHQGQKCNRRLPAQLKARNESVCSVAQSCPTLCNPVECGPPVSSVHGIFQARILEWVAISHSRRSSRPRDWTPVSCISCTGRRVLHHGATWETKNRDLPPKYSFLHLTSLKCTQPSKIRLLRQTMKSKIFLFPLSNIK